MSQILLRRRRVLSAVALTVAAAIALSACSSAETSTSGGDQVTLTMWTWSNEAKKALEGGILDSFTKNHPNITVEVLAQPDDSYQTLLTTGLAGSNGPDLAAVRSYGVISSFADSGNLVALDDVVSDWSGFSDIALQGVTSRSDGKIYAVPQGIQTAQIYYNKKIFSDLGLSVPKTWAEFLDTAKTIKDSGTAPIVIPGAVAGQIALAGEVLGNARRGGNAFTKKFVAGEVDLTADDNVESIALMKDIEPYLVDNVTSVTLDEAVTLFATGRAAMFPSGTWQVATFANMGATVDYGTFDLPVGADWPSPEVTVSYADGGWALARRSPHQEQAKELLNWLASTDYFQQYANAMGTIPPRGGVTIADPQISAMYERYLQSASTYLGIAYLRYGTPWGTDLFGEQVQKIWLGQQDAPGAAAEMQKGIDAWFDPADFAQ